MESEVTAVTAERFFRIAGRGGRLTEHENGEVRVAAFGVSEDSLHKEALMMREKLLLSDQERARLGSVVGATWDHFGAQASLDDGRYALVDMFVETDAGALTFAVQLTTLGLEGGIDEYAHLAVHCGAEGAAIARRKGDVFFHDRGRTITGVTIVRDVVSSSGAGDDAFELSSDTGVIIILDSGVVAICAGGPFASDLFITRAASLQALRLPDTSSDWGEDLTYQLVFRRQFIHLVEAAGMGDDT